MSAQKWQVKLPFTDAQTVVAEAWVRLFHRLIRERAFDDVLIDVADYSHVPRGPGVLLVGHSFDVRADDEGGLAGLTVCRKRGGHGDEAAALREVVLRALHAAGVAQLAPEVAGLGFDLARIVIRHNDRLVAPNDADTEARLCPVIEAVMRSVYGELFRGLTARLPDPRQRFEVTASASGPVTLDGMQHRLASGAQHGA